MMEEAIISGVTHDVSEAKITIEQVPDRPGVAASVFRALADDGVNVDMIVQNVSTQGHTDISFTVPRSDLAKTAVVMDKVVRRTEARGYRSDAEVGRVSLIGAGMKTHPARREDVRDVGRRRHQHRDDQHVDDPHLVRRARHRRRACGAHVAPRLRSGDGANEGWCHRGHWSGRQEMLRVLEERAFPVSELRVYASARSEGRKLAFNGGEVACQVLRPAVSTVSISWSSTSTSRSRRSGRRRPRRRERS